MSELNKEQKTRLIQNKALGQKKGSLVAADNKRNARQKRIEIMNKRAAKEIGFLSKREELMIGVSLYAAEGSKTDGKGGFTNADPRLIWFMSNWFRKYAKIPSGKMRGAIWLHEGLDENKAK